MSAPEAMPEQKPTYFRARISSAFSGFPETGALIMKKQREILIEIERERTIYLRSRYQAQCAECDSAVEFLTPAEAAILAETSIEKIFQFAEIGALHTEVMSDGRLLVCLNSILGIRFF
jgi:hypothetical protein